MSSGTREAITVIISNALSRALALLVGALVLWAWSPRASAQACESPDARCLTDSALTNLRDAVVRIEYEDDQGETRMCTGTLLKTRGARGQMAMAPYVLTASHCVPNQTTAETVKTVWFHQRERCDGTGTDVRTVSHTGGADLLAQSGAETELGDWALIRLRTSVPAGAHYAPWSEQASFGTNGSSSATVVVLHHPRGEHLQYASGTARFSTPRTSAGPAGADSGLTVNMQQGEIAGGSSGAGYFHEGQLIGVLFGGGAGCPQKTSGSSMKGIYPHVARWLDPDADVTGPVLMSATVPVGGESITLTFDENLINRTGKTEAELDAYLAAIDAALDVQADGESIDVSVAFATLNNEQLLLQVAAPTFEQDQNVVITYADPTTGDDEAIEDESGNDAKSFTTGGDGVPAVVNNSTLVLAPRLVAGAEGAVIDGDRLTLTFNEALDPNSFPPAPGGFTLTVERGDPPTAVTAPTVTQIAASGAVLTATLSAGVRHGDTVTLAYAPPATNPLQDADMRRTRAFNARSVDNRTTLPTIALSAGMLEEGSTDTVTLALVTGGTTYAGAQTFTVVAEGDAKEGEDWSIASKSLALAAGETQATTTVSPIDDLRLEPDRTVEFKAQLSGMQSAGATLTIADDDTARIGLDVSATGVSAGDTITVTLALLPGDETRQTEDCIVAFPVTVALTIAGDTAALAQGVAAESEHTFPATSFDDCTGTLTVDIATREAQEGDTVPKTLTFDAATVTGQDARVRSATRVTVTVLSAPAVASIERLEPATSPTNADTLTWRVTFTEDVSNVDETDFTVDGTTGTVTSVTAHGGSASVYDVTVSGGDLAGLDGTVSLHVASGNDIKDSDALGLGSTTPFGANDNAYVVDNTGPTIASIAVSSTPAQGEIYVSGETISFKVTFTAPVMVTGSPKLAFLMGENGGDPEPREAAYEGGSESAALVFVYTVASGDLDPDGISWRANALDLDGGTIRLLTDDTINPDLGHGPKAEGTRQRVDAVAPRVVEVTFQGTEVEIRYDEALDGASTPEPGAYTVMVGETRATVDSAAISGETVVLTLQDAIGEVGDARVTVEYTAPGVSPVTDLVGNAAASFAPMSALPGRKVRLQGGDSRSEGRVELFHDGQWGTVCDDRWTKPAADVACRSAGYEAGSVDNATDFTRAYFGEGRSDAPILLENVECDGTEDSLFECRFGRMRNGARSMRIGDVGACRHKEDVGVRCLGGETGPPVITGIELAGSTDANGHYAHGTAVRATLLWSQPVAVTVPEGATGPQLIVAYDGTIRRYASYLSGSGAARTTFIHTVDFDGANTVAVPANAVRLSGARITSAADPGTAAELDHAEYPEPDAAPAITGVAIVGEPGADGSWSAGETARVNVTFDRQVTVTTSDSGPTIGLRIGTGTARRAAYEGGSGSVNLVFAYTLQTGDAASSSLTVPENSLALDGAGIQGRIAGLDATLAHGAVTRTDSATSTATASFSGVPAGHDGSAFQIGLDFSHVPDGLSYVTVRDSLLEVSGAEITGARRASPPSDQGWLIDVRPTGGDITITLPVRQCSDERGAVCFGGVPLSAPATARIGASFVVVFDEDGPFEHDGERRFNVLLSLSMMSASLSYRTVGSTKMFDVTGATIDGAYRHERNINDRWVLKLIPSGLGDVTITSKASPPCGHADAICTAEGIRLQGGTRHVVKGPTALSVSDAEVEEAAGAVLSFEVMLDRPRPRLVTTVDYRTEDITASAGTDCPGPDYVSATGRIVFQPGTSRRTVEISVCDDGEDEGTETMKLVLSDPSHNVRLEDDEGIGTITNTDPMPKAWITRFGRTVGSQVVVALTGRLESNGGSHITVGGVSLSAQPIPEEAPEEGRTLGLPERDARARLDAETRTMTREEMLLGSSFHLSGGGRYPGAPALSAWGRFATGGFDGEEDGVSLDGELTTGFIGADAKWDRFLAGVMVSESRGKGSYRLDAELGSDEGKVESTLTGVYPYLEAKPNERVSTWGVVGMGSGDLTLRRSGEVLETDLGMRMGALGLKGRVLDGPGASGVALNLKSEATWVRTESGRTEGMMGAEGEVSRVRLILQGERPLAMEDGSLFAPSAELGVRLEGGDAETGTGLELGAGLRYARGPLSIEGRFRGLVAHEASGYEEWGASGAIRVSPSESGRGLTFTLAPVWGQAGSQAERLWGARDARELDPDTDFEATGRIEAEVGYGFGIRGTRGVVTPYTGLSLEEGAGRTLWAGTRWNLGPGAEMGLEGTHRGGANGARGTNAIEFRTSIRW